MCGRLQVGKENLHVAGLVKARSVDAYVIHAASVAVSREHRRAKTDRLDSELLKRAFLGWLRGERDHCKMVAIPTPGRCAPPDRRCRAPSHGQNTFVARGWTR